jgi:hypothetical protein
MGIPEVWIRDYLPFQSHLWNFVDLWCRSRCVSRGVIEK